MTEGRSTKQGRFARWREQRRAGRRQAVGGERRASATRSGSEQGSSGGFFSGFWGGDGSCGDYGGGGGDFGGGGGDGGGGC
jgi:hypothetical protein